MIREKKIPMRDKSRIFQLLIEQNIFFRLFKYIIKPKLIVSKIIDILNKKNLPLEINWDERAKKLGKYSVIDSRFSPNEFNYVTTSEKKIWFPVLKKFLNGKEKTILDFGCGPGRFTEDLSKVINGNAVGVDTNLKLLKLAPKSPKVKYFKISKNLKEIKKKFDVIFIAHVLGGIQHKDLRILSEKIPLLLNKGGILFLNEYTNKKTYNYKKEKFLEWMTRSEEYYCKLFANLRLKKIDSYKYGETGIRGFVNVGNESSIFVGKKARQI